MHSETSIILMRNAGGEASGFRGVVRDVTKRKHAEDILRESEANLAAAPRITHLGSWELEFTDLENIGKNEVRWSDETYRIFGSEPREVEVSNELFYNSVHPDDRQMIANVYPIRLPKESLIPSNIGLFCPTIASDACWDRRS